MPLAADKRQSAVRPNGGMRGVAMAKADRGGDPEGFRGPGRPRSKIRQSEGSVLLKQNSYSRHEGTLRYAVYAADEQVG